MSAGCLVILVQLRSAQGDGAACFCTLVRLQYKLLHWCCWRRHVAEVFCPCEAECSTPFDNKSAVVIVSAVCKTGLCLLQVQAVNHVWQQAVATEGMNTQN